MSLDVTVCSTMPALHWWTFYENERWLPNTLTGDDRREVSRRMRWFLLGQWDGVRGSLDPKRDRSVEEKRALMEQVTVKKLQAVIVTKSTVEALKQPMTTDSSKSATPQLSSSSLSLAPYAEQCLEFLRGRVRWQDDGTMSLTDVTPDATTDVFALLDDATRGVEKIVIALTKAFRAKEV